MFFELGYTRKPPYLDQLSDLILNKLRLRLRVRSWLIRLMHQSIGCAVQRSHEAGIKVVSEEN